MIKQRLTTYYYRSKTINRHGNKKILIHVKYGIKDSRPNQVSSTYASPAFTQFSSTYKTTNFYFASALPWNLLSIISAFFTTAHLLTWYAASAYLKGRPFYSTIEYRNAQHRNLPPYMWIWLFCRGGESHFSGTSPVCISTAAVP
jgi:hypothetical protein